MSQLKRKLPDWIDAFMLYTENSEPPRLFRKWTAISTLASAMQRKIRVDWGNALVFYPNLYIVLVGPSATGKGTAMNPAQEIIHDLGTIRISAQATSLQALIRRLKETNLTDIDMVTGEQQYHSSMTIFSKEFTVFLGYHNRELMSALCDWYDCDRKWVYETISRKKEEIVGVWVNLIAGTTPDLIQSSLPIESIGGGLTSRIIFVYEETKEKLVVLPTQTQKELELKQYLIHDLEKVSRLSGSFKWTENFSNAWSDWCYYADNNPPFYDSKFDGYTGRRRAHVMKLAMVVSASHGKHDLILSKDDLDEAINLLIEVEVKMPLVFRGVGRSDTASMMHKVVTFLEHSATDEIPFYQFARHFSNDMDKIQMDNIIYSLESMKRIKYIKRPGADDMIKRLSMEDDEIVKKSNDLIPDPEPEDL